MTLWLHEGWCLQEDGSQLLSQLGQGMKTAVFAASHSAFPVCVLRRGPRPHILHEAEMMRRLNHPNVARLYAQLDSSQQNEEGEPVAFLVLQQLGPSLRNITRQPTYTQ